MSAHIAIPLTGSRLSLGGRLMVEAFRRARPRVHSIAVCYLGAAAHDEAGYCLDAPEMLPAGACRSFTFDDDDMPAIVEQVVCEREAA